MDYGTDGFPTSKDFAKGKSAATQVNHKFLKKLGKKRDKNTSWKTKAGTFTTNHKCKCEITLPEFYSNRSIKWTVYVDKSNSRSSRYGMIIGRDGLKELGIDLVFSEGLIK